MPCAEAISCGELADEVFLTDPATGEVNVIASLGHEGVVLDAAVLSDNSVVAVLVGDGTPVVRYRP